MPEAVPDVEKVGRHRWESEDGTEYKLTNLPSDPCHKCGGEIEDGDHCYFRDGPRADDGFDHICWDCGQEVTGFAE